MLKELEKAHFRPRGVNVVVCKKIDSSSRVLCLTKISSNVFEVRERNVKRKYC
jgi:hypothetical protein